jgi:hypothetical protein
VSNYKNSAAAKEIKIESTGRAIKFVTILGRLL